jgi:tripartite-type tricarboxylate transporter receptor subunit TctC
LFKLKTGTAGQLIPFKSSNESVLNVVGNQVTYAIAEPPPVVPQVTSGKARALAVASPRRLPELPDVPTMREAGVDMDVQLWLGLFAPAGTPAEIVARLNAEVTQALRIQDMQEKLASDGAEPVGTTPAEFAAHIKSELQKWANVARVAKIEPQ